MNKGQFTVIKKTQKDYSLAFKLQVVDEVEKGAISQHEAVRRYGIQSRSTVLVWLRKHGRLNWYQNAPMPKKAAPNKKIRELEKKLKILEAEKEILNTAIDVADELYKTNIRKKFLPLSRQNFEKQQGSQENIPSEE
jgi:transposase